MVIPLEPALFHQLRQENRFPEKEKIQIHVTPFSSFSHKKNDTNRLFLFDQKTSLEIGERVDVDHNYLKFDEISADDLTGQISLAPDITTYGLRIDCLINLSKFLKRASLRLTVPMQHVEHDPHFQINRATNSSVGEKGIADYFDGQPMVQASEELDDNETSLRNLQEPLQFGKIHGKHCKDGVADLHIRLSYDPLHNQTWIVRLNGFLTISTTSGARSQWLFEPRLGSGGHWGLGAGIQATKTLWQDTEEAPSRTLEVLMDGRYHYFFGNHERRILGLKNNKGSQLNWSHYLLLGQNQTPRVLPAANVLAEDVRVKPGSQFEAMIMLAYRHEGSVFSIGFDSWFRQREMIRRRDTWRENTYGFPGIEYADDIFNFSSSDKATRDSSLFSLKNSNLTNTIATLRSVGPGAEQQGFVSASQLSMRPATSPQAFSNTFFGSYEHIWECQKRTFLLGLGFAHELPFDNAALQTTYLWVRGGLIF